MDKQQGPPVQHRELYSLSCDKPYGKGYEKEKKNKEVTRGKQEKFKSQGSVSFRKFCLRKVMHVLGAHASSSGACWTPASHKPTPHRSEPSGPSVVAPAIPTSGRVYCRGPSIPGNYTTGLWKWCEQKST